MKFFTHIFIFLIVLQLLFGSDTVALGEEPSRTVSLLVTILDSSNEPVTEFGIDVRIALADVRSAVTAIPNASGQAIMQVRVPDVAQELCVVLGPLFDASMDLSRKAKAHQKFLEIKKKFAMRRQYCVPVPADQSEFSLEIRLKSAVSVRGRMTTVAGEGVTGALSVNDYACYTWTKRDNAGDFELVGVPKGEPVELVLSGNHQVTRILQLTAEQTQGDLDLGDTFLEPIGGPSKARLFVPHDAEHASGSSRLFTVISVDAETIISVVVDAAGGQPRLPGLDPSKGWLPAGEYYVFPGSLHTDDAAWDLLDLIRAGKAKDHPEIPSFVATPDKEVSVTIDPNETKRSITEAAKAEALPEQ